MASGSVQKFKVGKNDTNKRADIYLAAIFPLYTRSSLKGLFDKKLVTVRGRVIKPSHKLISGDALSVDTALLSNEPEPISIPVIYEDKNVTVLDKPAGLLTHSKGALNSEATVASFIKPKLNDIDLTDNRAGIVHRLDRATSGVVVTAKNGLALKWLQKQFSTRKTVKIYHAIVEGEPKPHEALIDAPIGRNPKKPQTFRVSGDGRPAITHYKVLECFSKAGRTYCVVELTPKTGRTHQLRVHLKYIGRPIVGDRVYGNDAGHMYLHASSIELRLPGGELRKFQAKLPQYFKDFMKP